MYYTVNRWFRARTAVLYTGHTNIGHSAGDQGAATSERSICLRCWVSPIDRVVFAVWLQCWITRQLRCRLRHCVGRSSARHLFIAVDRSFFFYYFVSASSTSKSSSFCHPIRLFLYGFYWSGWCSASKKERIISGGGIERRREGWVGRCLAGITLLLRKTEIECVYQRGRERR